ncbi:MAG TPA: hypothetical protein VKB88_30045 [Bryobacteraceae bacterium]|nr:hypothetical protein [Bryobacteraceae bacterium]
MFGLLDGGDVGGLLDHADQALIAGRAAAIAAGIDIGDVVADGAQAQAGLDVTHGGRQGFGVVVAGAQDVEGQPLRAFAAHAGQLLQFLDQSRHRFCEFGHGSSLVAFEFRSTYRTRSVPYA